MTAYDFRFPNENKYLGTVEINREDGEALVRSWEFSDNFTWKNPRPSISSSEINSLLRKHEKG